MKYRFQVLLRAMPERFRSIRTRIALAILTTSVAALIIMALAIYLTFRTTLSENFDDTLRAASASNTALVDLTTVPPSLRLTPDPSLPASEDATFVRLYAVDGSLLADGKAAQASRLDLEAERGLVARAAGGSNQIASVPLAGGRFRELAVPIEEDGAVVAVLLTGIKPVSAQESLDILRAILLIVVPLTGLMLAIAAFVIARKALQPVRAITATAARISGGDLRQRIRGVMVEDEVGELASTFNRMIERLEEAFERQRRFTGDASHELRTPLTAMETGLEVILSQERSSEEYREALRTIQSRTAQLTRMARQLLMLSQLDAEAIEPAFIRIELADLIPVIVSSFREDHPDVAIIVAEVPPAAAIMGDAEMLARAIGNVLENTRLYANRPTATAIVVAVDDATVSIRLADNGPGFPPDLLPTVFERFRRNDNAKAAGGAGLGLAIVESIARLHHGSVSAHNEDGAVVVFRFPAVS